MGLLDGDIAETLGGLWHDDYLPGLLTRNTMVKVSGGELVKTPQPPVDCRYQRERTNQKMLEREGYTDRDARFFILTFNLVGDVDTDAQLRADSFDWEIIAAELDPAGVRWDVHARPLRKG